MKGVVIKFLRTKRFQGIWEKLLRISKVGMNYWGGASIYESGELYVLQYMKNKFKDKGNITLFDVGANRGDYALLAYETFGNNLSVFSFEPSIYTFNSLVENTKEIDSIQTFNFGFGENNCKVMLYTNAKESNLASVYKLSNPLHKFIEENSEEIIIKTIDSFCNQNNISMIDILKIDIEGHELYALKGAKELIRKKKIRYIQFEFGECQIDSRTFLRDFFTLFGEGYTFYRIVSDGLRPIKSYSSELEVFHTSNYLIELDTSITMK